MVTWRISCKIPKFHFTSGSCRATRRRRAFPPVCSCGGRTSRPSPGIAKLEAKIHHFLVYRDLLSLMRQPIDYVPELQSDALIKMNMICNIQSIWGRRLWHIWDILSDIPPGISHPFPFLAASQAPHFGPAMELLVRPGGHWAHGHSPATHPGPAQPMPSPTQQWPPVVASDRWPRGPPPCYSRNSDKVLQSSKFLHLQLQQS